MRAYDYVRETLAKLEQDKQRDRRLEVFSGLSPQLDELGSKLNAAKTTISTRQHDHLIAKFTELKLLAIEYLS